jgi:hypothetical protein
MSNDLLRQATEYRDSRIEEHARLRQSEPFVAQTKRPQRLTEGFAIGAHAICLMSTRAPHIYDEFLSFRFIDDLLQSAVAIWSLAKEGQLTAGKREMRYMLEAATKHAYVDLKLTKNPLPEKITFLSEQVPNSSMKFVDDFRLYSFTDVENKEFMDFIRSSYASLCRYVHRSPEQVEETLRLLKRGIAPAFETQREVESFVRELERLYDVVLVLLFNALGLSLTGDVFVHTLDGTKEWPFHKTHFTKKLSSSFDYKAERNPR